MFLAASFGGVVQARPWQKVVTPRFTLLTDTSDFQSRRTLTEFSDYLLYLDKVMPGDPKEMKPLTIVLLDSPKEYLEYEPRLPNGQTIEQAAKDDEIWSGSNFGTGPSWAVISAVQLENRTSTAGVTCYGGAMWYLTSVDKNLPPAVQTGLAAALAMRRGVNHAIIGEAVPGFMAVLQTWPSMTVEQLFQAKDMEAVFMQDKYTVFCAESWALMHYLLYDKVPIERNALAKFRQGLRSGETGHQALVDALGAEGAAHIDYTLRTYFRGQHILAKVEIGEEKSNHDPYQPVSEWEVQLALTRCALIAKNYASASTHASAAIAAEPDRPEGYDLRVEALYMQHPDAGDEGRAVIKAALDHHSQSAYVLSQSARNQWLAAGQAAGTPAQARAAVNGAERAVNADLNYQPGFDLLAQALPYADHITPADEKFLTYARRRFSTDRWILIGLAAYERKRGNADRAQNVETLAVSDHPGLDVGQRSAISKFLQSGRKELPVPSEEDALDSLRGLR